MVNNREVDKLSTWLSTGVDRTVVLVGAYRRSMSDRWLIELIGVVWILHWATIYGAAVLMICCRPPWKRLWQKLTVFPAGANRSATLEWPEIPALRRLRDGCDTSKSCTRFERRMARFDQRK